MSELATQSDVADLSATLARLNGELLEATDLESKRRITAEIQSWQNVKPVVEKANAEAAAKAAAHARAQQIAAAKESNETAFAGAPAIVAKFTKAEELLQAAYQEINTGLSMAEDFRASILTNVHVLDKDALSKNPANQQFRVRDQLLFRIETSHRFADLGPLFTGKISRDESALLPKSAQHTIDALARFAREIKPS